jgi:signal transduction histidine kinase
MPEPGVVRAILFVVSILVATGTASLAHAAAPIRADDPAIEAGMPIGRHVSTLSDPSNTLTVAELERAVAGKRLVDVDQDRPNFAYDTAPRWLVFTIEPGQRTGKLFLEVLQPSLDTVEFHRVRPDGGVERQTAGDQQPWGLRPVLHRNHVFCFEAPTHAPSTYYLKVASRNVLTVPLVLWTEDGFQTYTRDSQMGFGLFYGLILALFVYNLFLYLSLRDRAYLWYVCYVGTFGMALLVLDGFAFQYLWPDSVVWTNHAMGTFLSLAIVFGGLFARDFLGSAARFPRLDMAMLVAVALSGVLAIFSATGLVLEYGAIMRALSYVAPVGALITLWIGIRTLVAGFEPARYFLLAWGTLLTFVVIGSLRNFGLFPVNFFSTYGLHIGLCLDVVLLSTALAARIRDMQTQVIGAQRQLIETSREHQAALERRAGELSEANRELEAFSHTVAHDLRAPIRAIDGFANLLVAEHGPRLDNDARADLGAISRNARRMAELVDGLLEFSRLGRVPPQDTRVVTRAVVDAVLEEALAGRPVKVEIGPLPDVRADTLLLRQVWFNLIANAVKFSARAAEPHIAIGAELDAGEVRFWVRDNGVGFDPAYADKLFGMFQRLHAAGEFEGSGVGLATVRRIVERHGGRVWAEGAPGQGARFCFALPVERLVREDHGEPHAPRQ